MSTQITSAFSVRALDNHGLPVDTYEDTLQDAIASAELSTQYGPAYISTVIKVEEV